jgi:beta-xylosidase
MKSFILTIAVAALSVCSAGLAAGDEIFLLSYFKGNGETGVFLAASEDGLVFKTLNEGRPVFTPPQWQGQNLTRDPSIVYREGLFRMVWTSSWTGSCFGAATSTDLKRWSEPVRVEPFQNWPADDPPANTWAPEVHWDPVQKNYAILWSSATASLEGKGGHNSGGLENDPNRNVRPDIRHHRTFLSRTSDFKTFTDARVFFAPGVSEIDACMAFDDRGTTDPADDRWVMAVKNEQIPELGGKNIRLAVAPADLTNPFPPQFRSPTDPTKPWFAPVSGPGGLVQSNQWVEGPTLMKVGDEWRLYFDRYRIRSGRYALATSKDLIHWTDRTAEVDMPPDAHHGTIFRAPRAAAFKTITPP